MFDDRKSETFELKKLKWENILSQENMKIFANYDLDSLSDREKRKIIFDYLVNNSTYDYELLNRIRSCMARNPEKELEDYAETKHSVCNAIAEYYKMLLSYNNIYSICAVCIQQSESMPSGGHMLNLVYDDINKSYSFDDITMTIIERDFLKKKYGNLMYFESNKYFNYDLKSANEYGQGNEKPYNFIEGNYYLVNFGLMWSFFKERTMEEYKKYGVENPETFEVDYNVLNNVCRFDDEFINRR